MRGALAAVCEIVAQPLDLIRPRPGCPLPPPQRGPLCVYVCRVGSMRGGVSPALAVVLLPLRRLWCVPGAPPRV